jgi:hypothetical protein
MGADLVAPMPFDLQPGGRLLAQVSFDVDQWFTGISFPPGGDPVTIDATHNPEILTRFRTNVVQSATLGFQ